MLSVVRQLNVVVVAPVQPEPNVATLHMASYRNLGLGIGSKICGYIKSTRTNKASFLFDQR